jgi:hypothetical protein
LQAISFLLKNGFRMQAPLQEGVPYLSRREEEQAKQHVLERNARSSDLVALDIPESDTESLEFLRITREAIDAWLAKGEVCVLVDSSVKQRLMSFETESTRISEYSSKSWPARAGRC